MCVCVCVCVTSRLAALSGSTFMSFMTCAMTVYMMFAHHLALVIIPQIQLNLPVKARTSLSGTMPLLRQLEKTFLTSTIILCGMDKIRTSSLNLSSILVPIHTASVPETFLVLKLDPQSSTHVQDERQVLLSSPSWSL